MTKIYIKKLESEFPDKYETLTELHLLVIPNVGDYIELTSTEEAEVKWRRFNLDGSVDIHIL